MASGVNRLTSWKTSKRFMVFIVVLVISCVFLPSATVYGDSSSQWNKTYSGLNYFYANSIISSSDGGYVIAGSSAPYDNPSYVEDVYGFLLKIDSAGNVQWNKTIDKTSRDRFTSIIETSDGGYALAGYTGKDLAGWLVKTDKTGNVQWDATFGGGHNAHFQALVQTSDEGYAMAGTTESKDTNSGSWQRDFWIVKTDSSGHMQWNQTYGDPINDDHCYSLIQSFDGGFALAGVYNFGGYEQDAWLVKTDSAGFMQWNTTWSGTRDSEAQSLLQTRDGGFLAAGKTYSNLTYSQDGFLLKIKGDGQLEWDKVYGDKTDYEGFSSIIPTGDGGYAIAGTSNYKGWLVKVSSTGDLQLNSIFNGHLHLSFFNSVVQAIDGDYVVVGTTGGEQLDENKYTTVAWVVKTDGTPSETPIPSPTNEPQTSSYPTLNQNTPTQTETLSSEPFRLDFIWIEIGAFAALSIIVVLLVVGMFFMRRRLHALENKIKGAQN